MQRRGFLQLLGLSATAPLWGKVGLGDVFRWEPIRKSTPALVETSGPVTLQWVCRDLARELHALYGTVRHTAKNKIGMVDDQGTMLTDQRTLSIAPLDAWDGLTVEDARARIITPGIAALKPLFDKRPPFLCGELDVRLPGVEMAQRVTSTKTGWSVRGVQGYSAWDDCTLTRFDILTN